MLLQNWWYTTLVSSNSVLCPPLEKHITSDYVVLGGGVAGLHAAQQLAEAGKEVVLLEKTICGGSSSGRSSGFLTPDSELELNQLIRRFGKKGAQKLWSLALEGVELIVRNVKRYDIECDLQSQDSLFLGIGAKGAEAVEEEAEARKSLRYPFTLYNEKKLATITKGTGYNAAVRYPNSYGINALLYTQGMKRVLLGKGVRIFEGTEVQSIKGMKVITHLGSVQAKHILSCIDKATPALSSVASRVYHAQTFLTISEPLSAADIRYLFSGKQMMCWDSKLVYSYYRLTGDKRLLLGGGSPLTTYYPGYLNSPIVINSVIREFKKRFPKLQHVEFTHYWPGLIDITGDLLPIVDFDSVNSRVLHVGGCPGLPWAAFCGKYAARKLTDKKFKGEYDRYLNKERELLVSPGLQKVTGKIVSFAFNNLYAKYRQVSK